MAHKLSRLWKRGGKDQGAAQVMHAAGSSHVVAAGRTLIVAYKYPPAQYGGGWPTAAAALVDEVSEHAQTEPVFNESAPTWPGLVANVLDKIHDQFGDEPLNIQHVPLTGAAEAALIEALQNDPRTFREQYRFIG